MPRAHDQFVATRTSQVVAAVSGRVLASQSINRSPNAWAPTAYNAEGFIVSAPNRAAADDLRAALRDVLKDFSCRSAGPSWLDASDPSGHRAAVVDGTADPAAVLAGGVKIIPEAADDGVTPGVPDPWLIIEALRSRLGDDGTASVGLNHLMSSAEQVGGNPLAVGHGRVGLDLYGAAGWGGHGPVELMVQPRPASRGRRPRVVVLDTGIGDHPWFRADPAETTVRFADGSVVGPNIAASSALAANPESAGADPVVVDPMLGALPTHAGHGTFIAGLLRQACPAADIVALTVMSESGIVPEHKLIRALDVVLARQREEPNWADAIVLSLGYYAETGEDLSYTSGLKDVLLDLGRRGVAVFAAAGNDATRRQSFPAAFAVDPDFGDLDVLPVVSVAALNANGTVAPFSNDGPWVTAEALGVNLVSTSPALPDGGERSPCSVRGPGGRLRAGFDPDDFRSGYAVWSGTSFAAPLLAGEYLRRLLAAGFPLGNRDRRALLPLGRSSRLAPALMTVPAVST